MVTAPEGDDGASPRGAVRLPRSYRFLMDGPASSPGDERPHEVLAQGSEQALPDRHPPWSVRLRHLLVGTSARTAVSAGLLVVAVVGGAVWYAGRPSLPALEHPQRLTALRHAPDPFPGPFGTRTVEGLAVAHQLSAPPAPAQDSFIASAGHVLLFLQVSNGGTQPVRIVDGLVPQVGSQPDLSAGGLSAGTSNGRALGAGQTAEVFVRLRLDCSVALAGPPADRLLLVSQVTGRRPQLQALPMDPLAPLWDEARHAACSPPAPARAVTARLLPGSLKAMRAASGALVVHGTLRVHDSAGFAAVLVWGAGASAAVSGGSTLTVSVGWQAGTCAQPAAAPPPPSYRVRLPDGAAVTTAEVDIGFATDWAAALHAACS
jgi:hypothetical protein